jgi:two-component system chemotaxis family response regulator WspR
MKIRVLMVDDQAVILAALAEMLGDAEDLELRAVPDPSRAMVEALQFEPAVILQDLVMEGTDGLALLRRYRAHPQLLDVPVVMLSAAEEPETKVEAFRCGANDYVVKLPSALELAARIRHHGRAFHNARQREQAFQALLESQMALHERQVEIERQKSQLEQQARQLEAVNRELADAALSDALTGLRNRRYLKVYLDLPDLPPGELHQPERRRRAGPRLTYFVFDLDHFKSINDRHGHEVGDVVLVEVARRLRATVRAGDAVMRWGGEEFMVVARGIDAEGARTLAHRILEAIGGEMIAFPGGDLRVTASLGYAPCPWRAATESAADSEAASADAHDFAISLADAGAYLAKLDGRNRAYGALPGPDLHFRERLGGVSLGPGVLRPEDGRGVSLVAVAGPQ